MVISKKINYVYITTNILTGLKYVGSHCTDNIDDNYLGSGRYFIKAVQKYGKNNFRREILEHCDNIRLARELEEKYIREHNTLFPNGYNLSPTGGCERGISGALSDEHKKSIRRWQSGKTYEEIYGEERAKEIKEKQNQLKIGRKQSQETINKRIKKIKGTQKGKTYEEMYGEEKANIMKEKQRLAKLGKSTSRKGKGFKLQFIEIYGEEEGLKKYNIFIEKQRKSHLKKYD